MGHSQPSKDLQQPRRQSLPADCGNTIACRLLPVTAGKKPLAMLATLLISVACARPSPAPGGRTYSALRQELAGPISPDQLNIILITIDTLRADRLSIYGSDVQTPHLDRVAEQGVLFSNASTTVPFTLPAHASILTGTYPPFHGVRENVGYFLGETSTTLAERLQVVGFETAGFVSAFVLDSRWGIARGFDHYYDDFDLGAFENPNLGSVQRPGAETIAAAQSWLDERESRATGDRPFFLWLHLYDPHDPYTPPEPFRSQYPRRPYDAEVAYTDALVGGFVEDLRTRGVLDRSVLVLTSDHGEGLGEHGEAFHGYFVYDSTVHVPLIVRTPGSAASARTVLERTVDDAVSHVDIAPTVLDLIGQELAPELQGRSLLPSVAGLPAPSRARETAGEEDPGGSSQVVYAESFYPLSHYGWAPLRALRTSKFKYIEAPKPELFEIRIDPGERQNLFDSRAEVGRPLARQLRALAARIEEGAARTSTPDLDEQTLAQLRALGYLAGRGENQPTGYDPDVPRADPKDKVHLHRLIQRAQSMVSGSQEEEATGLLRQALAEDPELLDAHQMLGNLELEAGRVAEAEGHFQRALSLDDRHQPSLFGLATVHLRLERTEDALLGYSRLLEIAGQDSKATLAIADIEVERGQLDQARATLARAAVPGAPAILFNRLGEVEALAGRPEEARQQFQSAIEASDRLSQPHFNLAVMLEQSNDLERAKTEYEIAIAKAPKHYQAQFNLARLHGRLGDSGRERQLLEQSIESKPDFAIGHFFLGKSLMETDQLERAEQVTRAGLQWLEDSQLGWFVLADILNRQGRGAEAARALERGEASSE